MNKFFEKIPFIDNILKGIGQIMLQENRWTGFLFLIGIFMGSWQCGVAVLLSTAAGTFTAMKLNYNKSEINAGLYGFSAALVGVALAFLFETTILIWVLIVLGGALAAIIQHFFIQKKIPVFTFPFIIITWVLVFTLHHFTHIPPSVMLSSEVVPTKYDDFLTCTNGFGEVIFQGGVLSGMIFFLAVFISSPIAALYGLTASILGAGLSQLNGEPIKEIHMGLFGFNAVLSAIVFSGFKKTDGIWVLIAVLLTIVVDDILIDNHYLDAVGGVFTFPFVAGTWITLLIQKIFFKARA
ncbi:MULTISPECIES: urea transporter [Chryseobacterium]|uniref:Urea transporter n=1 Tax=Chryseobacterium rhizosphaerae TaxID=395937 RepID=A0ABX9IK39_9FLAO|nr:MULTISPECIES: urea transporter [Chryseobacterium]MDC8101220.1 urea transporter [Chryseobacterium rhizosphaerae]MDR6545440.1 urea transporter [Chryseobacterium rhizosphaerae]REC75223.1 urea transporter [Chryseobacterium rhizosphaerae]SMC68684.1 urea transporter [Chryseobacterium sp. YR221]GEN69779.1 urea transporter [Chryseobacterium rhizosphaerae]